MRKWTLIVLSLTLILGCVPPEEIVQEVPASDVTDPNLDDEWIALFDGETLDGWTASENVESFSVQDGVIVADGPRSHLYYTGPVGDHNFRNFELKVEVLTKPGANSGVYFHTQFQDEGWPTKGYEAQVNNSGADVRRTGSLYDIADVYETKAKDDEWFTQHIIVQGKHIVVKVDDETVVDYHEPENPDQHIVSDRDRLLDRGRLLDSGTFALQGHDPESKVLFRNITVRLR
jgi:hypothetical protein